MVDGIGHHAARGAPEVSNAADDDNPIRARPRLASGPAIKGTRLLVAQ